MSSLTEHERRVLQADDFNAMNSLLASVQCELLDTARKLRTPEQKQKCRDMDALISGKMTLFKSGLLGSSESPPVSFQEWRRAAADKSRQKNALQIAEMFSRLLSVSAVDRRSVSPHVYKRAASAAFRAQNKALSGALKRLVRNWVERNSQKKAAEKGELFARLLSISSVWDLLQANRQEQRFLPRVPCRMQKRALLRAFCAWQTDACSRASAEDKLRRGLMRMVQVKQAACFGVFRAQAEEARTDQALLAKGLLWMVQKASHRGGCASLLLDQWVRWRGWAGEAKLQQQRVAGWTLRRTYKIWQAHGRGVWCRRLRTIMHVKQAAGWGTWRAFAREIKLQQQRVAGVLNRIKSNVVSRAFEAWRANGREGEITDNETVLSQLMHARASRNPRFFYLLLRPPVVTNPIVF